SSSRNTRLNVSWLGGPCSNLRNLRRKPSFARPKTCISTAVWPPHKTVHKAIIRISSRLCRPALPVRGSSRPSKHAANASIPSPTREPQHHAGRIDSLSRRNTQPKCQEHSKCDSPAVLPRRGRVGAVREAILSRRGREGAVREA